MTEDRAPYLRGVGPVEDLTPVLTESVAQELIRKIADHERRLFVLERQRNKLVDGLVRLRWLQRPIDGHDIDLLLERLES